MLTVQVHTFVRTLSLNSASIKDWPISTWVGITDPKAWAVQLAWPLGRGDMRSSTFWKGDNSWSRETENKGKSLNLWPAGLVVGPGPLSAVLCQLWEAHHSPLHLHRVQRGSGVELEWGQMFYVRGHLVKGFLPSPRKLEHHPPSSF